MKLIKLQGELGTVNTYVRDYMASDSENEKKTRL